jgi:hypothetical protein
LPTISHSQGADAESIVNFNGFHSVVGAETVKSPQELSNIAAEWLEARIAHKSLKGL